MIDRGAIARLLEVIGGDVDDLRELLEEFHSSTPALVDQMQAAAASGDTDALRIAAHSLKSNSRDFGALALGDLCEGLEHDCRAGAVTDGPARVAAISHELAVVRGVLNGIVADE